MEHTVNQRAVPGNAEPEDESDGDRGQPLLPHLDFVLEVKRVPGDRARAAMAELAHGVLDVFDAPAWLTGRISDTAGIAAHYVVRHSEASRCQLRLSVDPGGVTMAATDWDDRLRTGKPTWLPGSPHDRLPLPRRPEAYASTVAADDDSDCDQLLLHRTPDGHVRLGYHTPWPARAPGS